MSKKNSITVVLKPVKQKNKEVLEFTYKEAQRYFLKSKSYCNFDLPSYFDFKPLLSKVHKELNGKALSTFKQVNPRQYDDVNYTILDNKDGRYAWRPRQLIHPALYVSLVHQITTKENWKIIRKKFKDFAIDKRIECLSIPSKSLTKNSDKAEQVSNWWQHFEQRSLELALDYKYLTHTDITNCYGSIYTHSVSWAIHGKDVMKEKKNRGDKSFIGNVIDWHLQDMSHGQTNGIPQDSALMDLIAEMILGYADSELLEKILKESEIKNYKILRYRDDYRIFTNNPRDGEHILKSLTEVLIGLGLKLNAEKTNASSDVITSSIKSDKLYWMMQNQKESNPQKRLLIIRELAKRHPKSGSLLAALDKFYLPLNHFKKFKINVVPLLSIIVDIAYNNPRIYPHFATIVSFLLNQISCKKEKERILKKIRCKFKDIPNTAHLLIWLQRIYLGIKVEMDFKEKMCQIALDKKISLWNNSWLKKNIRDQIETTPIINKKIIKKLTPVISKKERSLFKSNYYGGY